jgi:predicted PhzF superfamily epimerase YddE/YHI9
VRIVQVDAFTDRAFSGNPAAVCVLPEAADEAWMQRVALEMNLSETAFLVARADGYDLRWFTPSVEVDLCGHATLASAHVLWEDGHTKEDDISFHTRSGVLTAARDGSWIVLDFPARAAVVTEVPAAVLEGVGGAPIVCARSEGSYFLEYATEEEVRDLTPNFSKLGSLADAYVSVSAAASTPGFDFVSRFFAVTAGIDEDPVTGSAHCTLGPWWAAKLGKTDLVGYQVSARGGTVRVRPEGDRVKLLGQAVTVMRGELLV